MVRFGRAGECPKGFLPVHSVDTPEQAKALLTLACQTNRNGEYIARELVHPDRSISDLELFATRLQECERMLIERGHKAWSGSTSNQESS